MKTSGIQAEKTRRSIQLGSLRRGRMPNANAFCDSFEISQDTIRITTDPNTDLWQRTYYHFRNDNASVLQMSTDKQIINHLNQDNYDKSRYGERVLVQM